MIHSFADDVTGSAGLAGNFDQTNLRNLFNPCTQIEMYMHDKDLL